MKKEHKFFLVGLLIGAAIIYMALAPVEEVEKPAETTSVVPNNVKITGYAIPATVDFAGEKVPLQRQDIVEKLDREIQVNAFWHSSTILLIKRANKWLPVIDSILAKNGIPSDFKYLAVIESGLQNVKSPKKAIGYWQFLKGTGREYGLEVTREVDERYDPLKATEAACKYLNESYGKFGNWVDVAVSYNMGMNGAARALENQGANSFFDLTLSEEPSRYVYRILAVKEILERPEAFGFFIPKEQLYVQENFSTLQVNKSIDDLVLFSKNQNTTLHNIKRLNPWLRSKKLTVKSGKKYTLHLPK